MLILSSPAARALTVIHKPGNKLERVMLWPQPRVDRTRESPLDSALFRPTSSAGTEEWRTGNVREELDSDRGEQGWMGWLMGLEPTTTGITIRDSTS